MRITIEIDAENSDDILKALQEFCSEDDPIFYRGQETTPYQLLMPGGPHQGTFTGKISYWAQGVRFIENGTFAGMIRDRERLAQGRTEGRA